MFSVWIKGICLQPDVIEGERFRTNAPINVKPQSRGAGYPREIDSASFSLDGDFDIRVLPWVWEFDIAMTCYGQKAVPRGGNLTFSRCPGVGNLTLALVKMSNSPGSAGPTLGLNIDRCITTTPGTPCPTLCN